MADSTHPLFDWEKLKTILAEEDDIRSEQKELLNRQCDLENERRDLCDPLVKRLALIGMTIRRNAMKYHSTTCEIEWSYPNHITDMRESLFHCWITVSLSHSVSRSTFCGFTKKERPLYSFNLSIPNTWIDLDEPTLALEIEASAQGIHKHFYDALKKMNASQKSV